MNSSNSEVLNMGQRLCKDEGGDEPKLEKETQKSEIGSSSGEISIKSVSLTAIAPVPATSQTKPAVDDAAFMRFLDERTFKASKEAKLRWNKMSKNQRAMYAPRDDVSSSSDISVYASARCSLLGDVSSGAIERDCDQVFSTLIKSCKWKCPQSKKCTKPKGVGKKGSKKLGAKKSPKVKEKKCPKPKSEKKCPTPKSGKMCRKPTPKSEFPKC